MGGPPLCNSDNGTAETAMVSLIGQFASRQATSSHNGSWRGNFAVTIIHRRNYAQRAAGVSDTLGNNGLPIPEPGSIGTTQASRNRSNAIDTSVRDSNVHTILLL